jgi:hypothetical protein
VREKKPRGVFVGDEQIFNWKDLFNSGKFILRENVQFACPSVRVLFTYIRKYLCNIVLICTLCLCNIDIQGSRKHCKKETDAQLKANGQQCH